jgi:hypothetical protein
MINPEFWVAVAFVVRAAAAEAAKGKIADDLIVQGIRDVKAKLN